MSRLLTRSTAALLLAWACGGRVLAVEPDTFSKVVSFQYENSLDEPGTTIQSKVVSFQYFDSLGDENVTYATSPSASFFFPDGQSLYTSGTVRTPAGAAVAGASVTLKRSGTLFWQGVSDANGTFVTPGLGVANYSVTVTKDGYETLFDNALRQTTGLQSLDLRIHPLPTPPASTDVNREATQSEKQKLVPTLPGDMPGLLIFNGSVFVEVSGEHPMRSDRMTVVLTHGMGSSPTEWAAALAHLIHNNHVLGAEAPNIVAWDWHFPAAINLSNRIIPIDNAARQGPVLGQELLTRLGSGYSQRVHFIGHSLGTIVNRYACDFLHGQMPRAGSNPASHWNTALTQPHITLLDEAEVASVAGSNVITSARLGAKLAGWKGAVAAGVVAAYADWKSPVPSSGRWIDNYISLVGVQREEAVNICLLAPTVGYNMSDPIGSVLFAHSYAHLFYRSTAHSVISGVPPAVGYARSYEKALVFPPFGTGLTAGSLWYENLSTNDPLDLVLQPNPQPFEANAAIAPAMMIQTAPSAVYAAGNATLGGYMSAIRWAGDKGGAVIYKTQQVGVTVKQKVGNFWDALSDGAANALNSVSADSQLAGSFIAPVFSISLSNQSAPAPSPSIAAIKGLTVMNAPADAGTPGEPSSWLTVTVPEDAGMMAFDFKVTGEPEDDEIVCAINGQNIFALPGMFVTDGVTMSTDMMDVSAYAGQQIEVFFGLAGGTSTDCVLEVDGIRFVTVPIPKLALEDLGPNVRLDWPVAASGWVLETSENLAPSSWQPVTGLDQAVAHDGVASLVQAKASTTRFYRLRRL